MSTTEYRRSGSKLRVFIADDSPTIRARLIELITELEGVEIVGQAENVPEAIGAITALKPQVVILDIRMPGGSGFDVLQQVKQDDRPLPLVIMLTNYAHPEYRRKYLRAGADFFFDKSSEFERIAEVFETLRQCRTNTDTAIGPRPT